MSPLRRFARWLWTEPVAAVTPPQPFVHLVGLDRFRDDDVGECLLVTVAAAGQVVALALPEDAVLRALSGKPVEIVGSRHTGPAEIVPAK